MNEIVNRLQENEKLKIILVSFVTFFLMIVAIMSNSIVSAYQVTVNKEPFQYTSYFHIVYDNMPNGYKKIERTYYFNNVNELTFKRDSSNNVFLFGPNYESLDESSIRVHTISTLLDGTVIEQWYNYLYIDSYHISTFETNNKELADSVLSFRGGETVNPELKNPPTPTVTKKTVEGIVPAIIKVMETLIPVGLMIFGLILGIYLIKRLVAYFL